MMGVDRYDRRQAACSVGDLGGGASIRASIATIADKHSTVICRERCVFGGYRERLVLVQQRAVGGAGGLRRLRGEASWAKKATSGVRAAASIGIG